MYSHPAFAESIHTSERQAEEERLRCCCPS
jgi:hypothetical protein